MRLLDQHIVYGAAVALPDLIRTQAHRRVRDDQGNAVPFKVYSNFFAEFFFPSVPTGEVRNFFAENFPSPIFPLKRENESLEICLRRVPKWGETNLISLLPGCVLCYVASCEVWLLTGSVVVEE